MLYDKGHSVNGKAVFSSPEQMFTKSYCTTLGISVVIGCDIGMDKMLKFYVMGKALSGKLSCPTTGLVLAE